MAVSISQERKRTHPNKNNFSGAWPNLLPARSCPADTAPAASTVGELRTGRPPLSAGASGERHRRRTRGQRSRSRTERIGHTWAPPLPRAPRHAFSSERWSPRWPRNRDHPQSRSLRSLERLEREEAIAEIYNKVIFFNKRETREWWIDSDFGRQRWYLNFKLFPSVCITKQKAKDNKGS